MNRVRRSALLLAAIAAMSAASCAGGAPLMHPAHVLSQGHTRFAAGAAANFTAGEASDAINNADAERITAVVDKPSPTYTAGALAVAAFAPGVAPFVAGRVGLGYDAEGGLSYTGHAMRIDARYALQGDTTALSVGVGGSALLARRGTITNAQLGGLNLEGVSGWGADVPVVFGWRSSGDIVWWWAGARGGYEKLRGTVTLFVPTVPDPLDGDIDAHRLMVAGLTGLAVGFRHFHAAVEVQGAYQDAQGALWGTDVQVKGFTFSPSAALLGSF